MDRYRMTLVLEEITDNQPGKVTRTAAQVEVAPFEYNAIPYQYRDDWYRNIMVKLFNEILAKKGKEQYEGTEKN